MDKILIFGINGFTGKHIQKYMTEQMAPGAYKVVGVDQQIDQISNIEYIQADLTNLRDLKHAITSVHPDYIINLVGVFQRQMPFNTLLKINALITKNIFEIVQSEKIRVKKTLIVGTAAEYGNYDVLPIKESRSSIPLSEYGLSKSMQTDIALYYQKNFNLNISIARPFNIIGKNISEDLSIGSFVKQIKKAQKGETIYVGNLQAKRDYLDISDVINAYFSILRKGVNGRIYNVCSGTSHRMEDILNRLIALAEKDIHVAKNEMFVNERDISDIYGDNNRLKTDTGWKQQVDIQSALAMAIMD